MCRVLGVARSTYYEVTSRPFSKRRSRKNSLQKKILLFWRESGKKYGAPKLHVLLQNEGYCLSLRTVSRYMKEINIRSITVKKYRPVNSIGTIQERENLLEGDFTTESIHEKWCTDITYIHTVKDGWTYLASVLDLHSRKIVGYAYGKNMTTELAVNAVKNVLFNTRPSSQVVLHSDLGTQYTSDEFMNFAGVNHLLQSFSAKGNPYHNKDQKILAHEMRFVKQNYERLWNLFMRFSKKKKCIERNTTITKPQNENSLYLSRAGTTEDASTVPLGTRRLTKHIGSLASVKLSLSNMLARSSYRLFALAEVIFVTKLNKEGYHHEVIRTLYCDYTYKQFGAT